jgi:hypothetical protein
MEETHPSMLMSVDLPAPLVPITRVHPRCSSMDTLLTATRPPHLRVIPRPRRRIRGEAITHSPAGLRTATREAPLQALANLRRQPDQPLRQERDGQDDHDAEAETPMLGEAAEDRLGLEELLQRANAKAPINAPRSWPMPPRMIMISTAPEGASSPSRD